ncbi:MAG: hypothetical protein OEU90_05310 [Gammaproteobacteria bacterium]|nr:hypothetical protein [Gammaproteobacteria bacterium]MDH3804879.1 hypothetical protein [Gammaproteobacteria bacterium]MDH3834967.1 hypothetical protein [Nitrosopumilus sp.]
MKTRTARLLGTFLLILISTQSHAQGAVKQTTDVRGQGIDGDVVSPNGTTLIRTKNGISVAVSMPTPMSGTYNYPPANPFQPVDAMPGTPEAFTGWVFFFNNPEACEIRNACVPPPPGAPGPNDFTEAAGGAYNFAGHAVSGGGSLNMVGHISVGESNFGGPSTLQNPYGAEIHVAIAPHGIVIPGLLPGQFNTPIGGPPFWWVSLFLAPEET